MLAFMTPFTALFFVAAACIVRLVEAVPLTVSEARRDVADPPVTAPNASTVWVVGETQTVVWDTSSLPDQITNTNGTVLLGFMNDTTSGEHLMADSPLASGFDIRSGSVDIVVPDVESRTDYIIALLGDSGNISNKFTIKSSSSPSSATSSASPSTTSSSAATVSESTVSPESTTSSHSADSPSGTSLSSATSPVTTLTSSGTLAALSSESSASGTASASQITTSASTSAACALLSFSRLVQLIVPMLCVFILA